MSDFYKYKIIITLIGIIGIILILLVLKPTIIDTDYIQNLEEKLNIYERSYEEFCLEDSIKQSDVYE